MKSKTTRISIFALAMVLSLSAYGMGGKRDNQNQNQEQGTTEDYNDDRGGSVAPSTEDESGVVGQEEGTIGVMPTPMPTTDDMGGTVGKTDDSNFDTSTTERSE